MFFDTFMNHCEVFVILIWHCLVDQKLDLNFENNSENWTYHISQYFRFQKNTAMEAQVVKYLRKKC